MESVKIRYGEAAQAREEALCCPVSYDPKFLEVIPQDVLDRDYGCGDPSAYVRPGETVLDLGAGGGKICFIAAQIVGPQGRVIGVDMTDEMLARARENADESGRDNVEFRKGLIESLPVEDDSVDLVISNCVINLSTEKPRVFAEAFRVLKPGGRLYVSDLMLAKPLPGGLAGSIEAYVGCIAGTLLKEDYLATVRGAGFEDVRALSERTFGPVLQEQFPELLAAGGIAGLTEAQLADAAESVLSVQVAATKPPAAG